MQLCVPDLVEQAYDRLGALWRKLSGHGGDRGGLFRLEIHGKIAARRTPAGVDPPARRETAAGKIAGRQTIDLQAIGVNSDACARIARLEAGERGAVDIGCNAHLARPFQR